MNIIRIDETYAEKIAPLVAAFRVALQSFKGIDSAPDTEAGREEILEYLEAGYPVFAAEENGGLLGYAVCKTDGPCLWVEQLFVRPERRRQGIATLLFEKAEQLAEKMGGDTCFNWVHPNNEGIIRFLRARGYTVLNLIEIRKPFEGEQLSTTIRVEDNVFDY